MPGVFKPNPVGIAEFAVSSGMHMGMGAIAEVLAEFVRSLTPSLTTYYGTTSAEDPPLANSIVVALTPEGAAVGATDYQFLFEEFGFVHQGSGESIPGTAPFRRALEQFSAGSKAVVKYGKRGSSGG